jgi:sterol desaturase/sphingolipid hydroxylase (fatty acid hydroxylase superfamily)
MPHSIDRADVSVPGPAGWRPAVLSDAGEQGALRLAVFALVCLSLGLWEAWRPRRRDARRRARWPVNLSLAAVNTVVVRILAPASGVSFALLAEDRDLGLLHAVTLPAWVEFTVAVLVLDAAVYVQHRLFHAVPWLWRLHRLHHADRGFDFTTGVRFHPGEIAISTLYKGAFIVALAASPEAVLVFEIILSTGSLFSHANARLGGDRAWRLVVVTPDMHRVHHSTARDEQNSNFGFSFSWWDRVGGTYRPAPRQAHETMPLGIGPPPA